jgi:4-hydroxybenzoate polyprenyltransferase
VWQIFGACSVIAVAIAGTIDPLAAAVMLASILINVLYSLPPVRVSYRTFLAPLFLAVGYVCVPYLLGTIAVQGTLGQDDLFWIGGLYLLFVGRIMLKDFRDRKGDAKYGKPTFLLRYGKKATCVASGALIVLGGGVLGWQLRDEPWLTVLAVVFVGTIVAMLVRLYRATPGPDEQLSIGVGAKMGNGLLIALFAALLLADSHLGSTERLLAVWLVALPFFLNLVMFVRDPAKAAIGYKG